MRLEKLFGSKTKVDILRYLLFKREGVSMRALETDLERTFPAIKKQIDSLQEASILDINKEGNSRSIHIKEAFKPILKSILIYSMKHDLNHIFQKYDTNIHKYIFGQIFGNTIENIDLIVIYKDLEDKEINNIKKNISEIFNINFISQVYVVFMSLDERKKRYRLADRFVLDIMRQLPESKSVVEK